MNWDAIGAIGEVIGALGVLATLVYLSVQIRAQNRAMRIQNMRAQAVEKQSVYSMQSSPDILHTAMRKAYSLESDLEWAEQYALEGYLGSYLASAECDFQLYSEGLTSEEDWRASKYQLELFLNNPFVLKWWEELARPAYRESFARQVDLIIQSFDGVPSRYKEQIRSDK